MSRTRLMLESLDARINPVVWNNPWPDPGHLTISFAPDGTDIDGAPSALAQEFAGVPTAAWQHEILRALQTWAAQTNITLAVVPDDGAAFGLPGPVQGDPGHGDIRIGARPLGPDQLAITTPFDLVGGWSGDVILNTDRALAPGGAGGEYDLYTVALQEAGHALGLPNNPATDSAMYTFYQGPRAGLSGDDISAIRNLYGDRAADPFDDGSGNNRLSDAKEIKFVAALGDLKGTDGTGGGTPYVAAGDLTALTDVDYYKVKLPGGTSSFSVVLRAGGSLLQARLSVLSSSGAVLATAAGAGTLTATVGGLNGGTYYLKVEAGTGNESGVGAYRLAAGPGAAQAVVPPVVVGYFAQDTFSNDALDKRTDLGTLTQGDDLRWDRALQASIHAAQDVDFYKVRTPKNSTGSLVLTAWGLGGTGLSPGLLLVNKDGQVVPVEVLSRGGGAIAIQLPTAQSDTEYFIRVAAPPVGTRTGNYGLAVDYRARADGSMTFAAGALTQAVPQAEMTLQTWEPALLHFALSVVGPDAAARAGVRMTIYDAGGREVFTQTAEAGQGAAGDVLLAAGAYTIVFTGGTPTGEAVPDLAFALDGLVRSDPIGLTGTNTATAPTGGTTKTPTTSTTRPTTGTYTSPYRPL